MNATRLSVRASSLWIALGVLALLAAVSASVSVSPAFSQEGGAAGDMIEIAAGEFWMGAVDKRKGQRGVALGVWERNGVRVTG